MKHLNTFSLSYNIFNILLKFPTLKFILTLMKEQKCTPTGEYI